MPMRQKTRLYKKKGSQQTRQSSQRFVLSYHLIGRSRGWVQTETQTSREAGFFLTITQSEIKGNIKRVFIAGGTV
jgi:hypothetical protein